MNVSNINNYQSGFIYNPVAKTNPLDTDPFTKNPQAFNPIVGTNSLEPVAKTSETGKNKENNNQSNPQNTETQTESKSKSNSVNGQQLTQAELQLLEELKIIDAEVRRHEMAHIATGGRYITSGANFTYKRGPDGKNYAVGGEVSIDTSPVPGDPQATLQKMRQVKNAALAPANPSSQDLRVASKATSNASKALSDLMISQIKERTESNGNKAFGGLKKAADSYERVNNLPEDDTSSFRIAV